MDFKKILDDYMKLLNCTAKDLSENSGLSATTISRYRSGERIPEGGTENFARLINGIVSIANREKIPDISVQSVSDAFSPYIKNSIDIAHLQKNFHTLLTALSINISDLARFLNFDPSYISRIRNGQRQPANPAEFAQKISVFVARHCQTEEQKAVISNLINCHRKDLSNYTRFHNLLADWLIAGTGNVKDSMTVFLEKLDEFNLEEYIHVIHFDKLKVPSVPFQLPTSKYYYGLKEMMDSELAFLKATVLSKSEDSVIMYSDMPISEMAKDPEFPKKWMFGMAMMLKKGLHLYQIHNIDRSFDEMMLGLESWIPMYMTGLVSPYYLKETQNYVFSHLLKVSGSVALSGESIRGHHDDGRYYLTKNKEEVNYYKKRAKQLLAKALPLMEIYRSEQEISYRNFLQNDSSLKGNRYSILSTLPLHTITDKLLCKILKNNHISEDEQAQIFQYVERQRNIAAKIGTHSTLTEEISVLTKDVFAKSPLTLSLSGMFFEKDIFYTWDEYQEHLHIINEYQRQHPYYHAVENMTPSFQNIQIRIHEGKWALVSKNKTPVIHFLIHHPKMLHAFENMAIPIIED